MEEVVSVSNPSQESLNQENETNKSMGDMDRLWRTMPKHNKKKMRQIKIFYREDKVKESMKM